MDMETVILIESKPKVYSKISDKSKDGTNEHKKGDENE